MVYLLLPHKPKPGGQFKETSFMWVFGITAKLIPTSELLALCSQFLKVESDPTACDCDLAPRLLLNIDNVKSWDSLVVQTVKKLPAVSENWVLSLGGTIPWRRAWQPTPVFLPGESPWTEEPVGLQSMGSRRF